jgi:Tfp pilus assembly protein PilF
MLALSVWQFVEGNIGNGIMWLLVMGLVILTYFRNENVLMAFYYLRKNNMPKAKKALERIKHPEQSLTKGQAAYYYMLMGMIESQQGIGKAESLLRKSLGMGLRQKHDQAMVKLQLAGIAIAKRRKREAMVLLTEVKKLDSKGILNEQVKMIKQQMKRI